jgi:hypothetical protein
MFFLYTHIYMLQLTKIKKTNSTLNKQKLQK